MNFIKRYLSDFFYFYQTVRYRLFIGLFFSLLVGTFDGLGLAMFLPLLEMVNSTSSSGEGLGRLDFIISWFEYLNVELTLIPVLVTMLVFFILKGIAKFLEGYYKLLVQIFFMEQTRIRNINYMKGFQYDAFVKADVGRIQNTLTSEISQLLSAYRSYFNVLQAIVMLTVYIFLAFLSNPQFAILVTVGGIVSNIGFRFIYEKTKAASRKITNSNHDFHGLIIQMVSFFKYLKATGQMKFYSNRLIRVVREIEDTNKKIGFYNTLVASIREPVVISIVVIVILVQTQVFGQSFGMILLSLLFFYRSLTYVLSFQNEWNRFLNVSGSIENMKDFEHGLKKHQELKGGELIESFDDKIKIKNVCYSYGEKQVLKDINLEIKKNEIVAFVGKSGAGKTTLANIISGLLPVSPKSIFIDNKDYNQLDNSSLGKKFGYITQDPVIFSDTIFNNVTFWDGLNEDNLCSFWKAAEDAHIDDFIKSLPNEQNDLLGSNGVNLSGGQKQRISIARELYKNVDILILDEATSSLDSETESIIQENLAELRGNYTFIVVAHRLSTIKLADKIVFFKDGKIEAIGNFDSLTNDSPDFANLVRLQGL